MEVFGYAFANQELLQTALTTPAFRMQHPEAQDNQRLEFLGDAVLGLLSAERLYERFPREAEGRLTVKRTRMVSSAALCASAVRLGLAARLLRNKGAEPLPDTSKTLADAVEAIIGAAYLDGGLDAARKVFDALGLDSNVACSESAANPKGELQIRAQAMKPPCRPAYSLVGTTGPAHAPVFTVKVSLEGVGEATASAGNRKEAETLAAAELLARMEEGA